MAGIYLNDVPVEIFLEYFNSTNSSDTENTVVKEQVLLSPVTYDNYYFPYDLSKLSSSNSSYDPTDYFGITGEEILSLYLYYYKILGYESESSDETLPLYTCPLITREISDDGVVYYNNSYLTYYTSNGGSSYTISYEDYPGIESDGETYNTLVTIKNVRTISDNNVETSYYTYTDSPSPYVEPYDEVRTFNSIIFYTLDVDSDDPENPYFSQEKFEYSDIITTDILATWEDNFDDLENSDYLIVYLNDANGNEISFYYYGRVSYFGTYETHVLKNSEDDTRYYAVVCKEVSVPRLTADGKNLYRDSDGLLTTKASYTNNFFTHQDAIRRAFNGVRENIGWTYKVGPRELVISKKGDKEYFEYYDQFQKISDEYSFSDTYGTDGSLVIGTIPYATYSKLLENYESNNNKYEDTSVAATYKLTHELISFSDYPNYDGYIDCGSSLSITTGFSFFSEGLYNSKTALTDTSSETSNFDAVINFYSRKAPLKSDPTTYININSSAKAETLSDDTSEAQAAYLKDSIKFYAIISDSASDKISVPETISTTVVDSSSSTGYTTTKTEIDAYENASVFNPETDEPYIIFNMFSDRDDLTDNIGKYVHIVLKSDSLR